MTPKPLIPVTFAPSRLALLVLALFAALIVLIMAACVSPLAALFTAGALFITLRPESRRVLPALCHDREQGWRYLDRHAGWQPAELDVFYAGAWLLGITCNGRRYWVWPDSAERDALWRFRRCCRSLLVRRL